MTDEELIEIGRLAVEWRRTPYVVDGSTAPWCGAHQRLERACDAAIERERNRVVLDDAARGLTMEDL